MASPFDKNLLPDFDSVKDNDEEILWTDKPTFMPYAITGIGAGIGIVFFIIVSFGITKNFNNQDGTPEGFSILFIAIPVGLFLWQFFKKILSYSNTTYGMTNKRVMMRTGTPTYGWPGWMP